MRTFRTLAAGAVVLVLAFSAPAAAADVELTDAQLDDAVLLSADVPDAGWDAAAPDTIESEPHTQVDATDGGWCGGPTDPYSADSLGTSGRSITTLSKVAAPDQPYWFIWEALYSFVSTDLATASAQAKAFMTTIRTQATSCTSWVAAGEPVNSISPARVPAPKVGDQRLAVHLSVVGDGVTSEENVVYVRVKNTVAVVHTRILPPDSTLLTKIVKKAVKKLKTAIAAA